MPSMAAQIGKAKPPSLPAFDGHRIAKGLPLAAGSMGVAHATRICALVLNLPFSPASPAPPVRPNVRFPDRRQP